MASVVAGHFIILQKRHLTHPNLIYFLTVFTLVSSVNTLASYSSNPCAKKRSTDFIFKLVLFFWFAYDL